jgi:pimeloyl-ACP methyl ester carboxylesterase
MSDFGSLHLIAVDLVGHGKSDKPHVRYTMEVFARSIDSVLTDAKIKRAVLVGHSMGTPVVRQFLRLFPEKTAGLVIVDGALRDAFFPKSRWINL